MLKKIVPQVWMHEYLAAAVVNCIALVVVEHVLISTSHVMGFFRPTSVAKHYFLWFNVVCTFEVETMHMSTTYSI